MKKIHSLLLSGMFAVGTLSTSWAMWGATTNFEGTIKSVNANTMIISNDSSYGQEVNLKTNDRTKLSGPVSAVDQLKEGDHVKVSYKEEGNEKIATAITKNQNSPSTSNLSD